MAPQKKRTYSKHDKNGAALAQDFHRKRIRGVEDDDELRLPTDTPRARPQSPFQPFNMKQKQKFKGPISFHDMLDNTETDSVPKKNKCLDVFDRVQAGKGKINPVSQKSNIHGSREDFENTMSNPDRARKTNAGATSHYLPTPPSDNEKQQMKNFDRFLPGLKGRGSNVIPKPSAPKLTPTITSSIFEDIIMKEEPKQPYVPKKYTSKGSPAPRRDICGSRSTSDSDNAKL